MPDSTAPDPARPVSGRLPVRALLIEDSAPYAVLVRELLFTARGLDVDLDWCERLDQAVARTASEEYDVILLDLGLPDAEGIQSVQATHAAAPLTPIIVLSGNEDTDLALQSVRHGAQDFILKSQLDRTRLGMAIRYAMERRRADAARRRNEARLAEVFAQMPEGILLLDASGRLMFVNPLAQEYLMGLTPERVQEGDVVPTLGGVPLDQIAPAGGADEHPVVLVGEGWSGPRTYEARVRVIAGRPAGQRLVSLREVTEDEELRRSLDTQHRVAAVGVLAARISESFSDQLKTIGEAAGELAAEVPADSDQGVRVQTLERQLVRAGAMVERIVRFSRDQGGPPRRVDLAETLLDLGEMLHHLIPEHIDIELELEPGEYPILAAPADLQQVFTNLAVNARDAMPDGGRMTLSLTRLVVVPGDLPPTAGVTPGRWAVASVADTGVGMSEEDLGKVFDPFFTTKSGHLATGLGLAQVFAMVRSVGGFVTACERVGPGARFVLYLPIAADIAADTGAKAIPAVEPLAGGTVLVVGQAGRARRRLIELLEGLGYQAHTAEDGVDATQLYADDSDRIDAIICHADPAMAGGPDGRDLAAALHDLDPLVRVLLMTDRSPSARTGRGHPAVHGWIQIPVEVQGLQAALAQAIQVVR